MMSVKTCTIFLAKYEQKFKLYCSSCWPELGCTVPDQPGCRVINHKCIKHIKVSSMSVTRLGF